MLPPEVLSLFSDDIRAMLNKHEAEYGFIEEIRVRLSQKLECIHKDSYRTLSCHIDDRAFRMILDKLFQSSRYRFTRQLQECYITLQGGHRVGLCGSVIMNGNEIDHIDTITSLNIRIQHQYLDFKFSHRQLYHQHRYANTIIIGPPNSGKTSFLRFLIEAINADQKPYDKKIAVIDERQEIIPVMPKENTGYLRVDTFSGCPKHLALPLLIRAMSPEVIFIDEIATHQDVEALLDSLKAGVSVICTVHGSSYEDVKTRLFFRKIIEYQLFDAYIILDAINKGTVNFKKIK